MFYNDHVADRIVVIFTDVDVEFIVPFIDEANCSHNDIRALLFCEFTRFENIVLSYLSDGDLFGLLVISMPSLRRIA